MAEGGWACAQRARERGPRRQTFAKQTARAWGADGGRWVEPLREPRKPREKYSTRSLSP